ncbi:hypothetical protein L210DRAFT_3519592 [Boletus edulis BED1]|uniref:Uncharacterized protein n=1 Tax=Boletus edulis BED1 TaxID=1328754 RepID=A0AAD4C9D0_BOLED|nr:hypothetical protein L210DRAFT_3519592 [Boletus edulis BED1]
MVVAKLVRELLIHRTTRERQMNRYMSLLIRDCLLYFFASILLNSLITLLAVLGIFPQGWAAQVLAFAANIPLYTLTPRFIINVRELYVLDLQGRMDLNIDSGFGLSSGARRDVGVSTTIGTIAFAERGTTSEPGHSEEMVMVGERAEVTGGRQVLVG